MKYRQITSGERYAISALRRRGLSARAIAAELGRAHTTISREIARNSCADGAYRPFKASHHTRGCRSRSRRNARIGPETWEVVERYLRLDWSPEQVAGFLRVEGVLRISHETIYVHIWHDKAHGGDLWTHLRQATKHYRKRYRSYDSRGRLAGKRHISERPLEVETREELGHWEIDTVKGDNQARHSVVTIVERATGYVRIGKLERHTAAICAARTIELIGRDPRGFSTITSDNGTEFHNYRDIEAATGVELYFATPHHSWERGTNENTNGLVRQYLPKRTSMTHVDQAECDAIAAKLNSRPRKRLGYKTPEECYVQAR
ncbi:MAG: IS30 family transposase [Coriobacteriia bacterium]|nr:IS30 family transposase [Coriobacteriia bacterium]